MALVYGSLAPHFLRSAWLPQPPIATSAGERGDPRGKVAPCGRSSWDNPWDTPGLFSRNIRGKAWEIDDDDDDDDDNDDDFDFCGNIMGI